MNIDMIRAAAKRLNGHARRTPLLTSPFLDDIAGRRVLVKPECLQHTGSFKFRGGWSAVSALDPETRKRGVIAYSSGNHAQGVALAAARHGIPSVIVMPTDAPRLKIENTRALGAEVVLYDRENEDRDAIGQRLAEERGLTLVRPYDEPLVIAGQGTTGLEIAAQLLEMEAEAAHVLVPCGGGGLTSGIALALAADAPAPRFKIEAIRDPRSAALARLQVVKGWADGEETFEQVYDVGGPFREAVTAVMPRSSPVPAPLNGFTTSKNASK